MNKVFTIMASINDEIGSFLGLIFGVALAGFICYSVGKALDEERNYQRKKIAEEREARKKGKKIKRTARERIRRFFFYYFPMIILAMIIIGILILFFHR